MLPIFCWPLIQSPHLPLPPFPQYWPPSILTSISPPLPQSPHLPLPPGGCTRGLGMQPGTPQPCSPRDPANLPPPPPVLTPPVAGAGPSPAAEQAREGGGWWPLALGHRLHRRIHDPPGQDEPAAPGTVLAPSLLPPRPELRAGFRAPVWPRKE